MSYMELVVEFKDGSRDWIDPVEPKDITDDGENVTVNAFNGHVYSYEKTKIKKWTVRPYSPDTTYEPIGEE